MRDNSKNWIQLMNVMWFLNIVVDLINKLVVNRRINHNFRNFIEMFIE